MPPVTETAKVVVKKTVGRQGVGFSKQKILSVITLVLAAAPSIIPDLAFGVPAEVQRGLIGLCALLTIVSREMQKNL